MYLTEYRKQRLNNLLLTKLAIYLFIALMLLSGFAN